ncbi:MurR/RpiR family transcriptional regulator [Breznakia pachnodae]|uniref:DNA-binding MurR/RpiR family transcriptional regulator n=1 Tax=Breznakia pachnodae TaxID=265178 RepID=A0ABU0DZW0_9FIRM|nr:MurR/RpiR family transcriptional regulator [Breznakia pachnodae]MDQ0360174.1 DNA-binding MurR/RpiR family transcriptional regulator [Breznakia pachnodae]
MNVKLELRNQYSDFSKTNKRIADFILQQPEQFLKMTAIDVALESQTSSASIIRFVKSLGFSGLEDFKIALARSTTQSETSDNIDPIISKDDNVEVLCEKMNSLVSSANEDFYYQLDYQALEESIKIIQKARKIYLLGIGASSLPAYDLFHKLNRANIDTFFNFDAHMTVEFFNYLTNEDVVIAFSYSGRTTEVIYPVEVAKQKGASIISVTRNKESKLSRLSTIALHVPNNEHLTRVGAIASKYTSMLVADLLYLGAIQSNLDVIEKELLKTSKLTRALKTKDNGD